MVHEPEAVDVPVIVPDQPASQLQSLPASLPAGLPLFEGHPEHDSAVLVAALNVSAGHLPHDVPSLFCPGPHSLMQEPEAVDVPVMVPDQPALQLQSSAASLPTGLPLFEGQSEHDVAVLVAALK